MCYSFDKEHAKKYGVEEAIMLQNFIFWIGKNRANNKHIYDNKTWTYNSVKAFKELFVFWTDKQLRRIIESLVSQKLIVRGNYNKSNIDRTGWYALVDEDAFLGTADLPKKENAFAQTGEAIPDSKPDSKQSLSNDKEIIVNAFFGKTELKKVFESYLKMRRKIKKPATDEAVVLVRAKVFKLSEGDEDKAIEILNNSIANSWVGVFCLKVDNHKPPDSEVKSKARAAMESNDNFMKSRYGTEFNG